MRALAVKLALHADLARALRRDGRRQGAAYHQGQVDLLDADREGVRLRPGVPRRRDWRSRPTAAPASSRTIRSSSTAATRRSSRSTRARTTSRPLDLVARKLQANGGESFAAFLEEIERLRRASTSASPGIGAEVRALGEAARRARARRRRAHGLLHGRQDRPGDAGGEPVPRDDGRGDGRAPAARGGRRRGRLPRREEDDLAHEDVDFYRGKVLAAKYFASYMLPQTRRA